MKKIVQIIIAIIITLIGMIFIYEISNKKEEELKIIDNKKFKQEYERLNDKTDPNNEKEYLEVIVDEKMDITYITETEAIDIIRNKSGVIYFGYPECQWCRNMVPILLDAALETDIDTIYYLNIKDIRDEKSLDENGNIQTEKEGTKEYNELIKLLAQSLTPYKGLNDDTIKRLYAPTVLFIREGKVEFIHISTLEQQTDPYIPLDDNQYLELKNIYLKGIHKVLNDLCDESC